MATYIEKQVSWLIIGITVCTIFLFTQAYLYQWGQKPLSLVLYSVMTLLMVLMLLLFYQMRTTVDSSKITICYGIGCIKKEIPLDTISTMEHVKNKWYEGVGIKYLDGGILYSIRFTDSLELKFKNTRQFIRIGSQTPNLLEQAIRERNIKA